MSIYVFENQKRLEFIQEKENKKNKLKQKI